MFIVVAGGGKVGYSLAKALLDQGHEVVLLEKDRTRAEKITEELGSSVLIPQAADEGRWLLEAGVERADVVAAVTGDDEDNLIICQMAELVARRAGGRRPRTIARVNNPKNEEALLRLGVDATVSATQVIMSLIEQELPEHHIAHLMTLREAGIEFVEFVVPADGPCVRRAIGELALPPGTNLPLLVRRGTTLQPTPDTVIEPDDTIIALMPIEHEAAVRDLLVGQEEF